MCVGRVRAVPSVLACMATPRRRTASAVVFGLQGQERTEDEEHFAQIVSFKLDSGRSTAAIAEETESTEDEDSSDDSSAEQQQRPKFVQPQRSSLRTRSNDALLGLGQLAINNATASPRAKRASKGLVVRREGSAVPMPPKTALPSAEKKANGSYGERTTAACPCGTRARA